MEQGLGQGRAEAPQDSNRYDTGVMAALAGGEPYMLHAHLGTDWEQGILMLHYADDRNAYSEDREGLNEHVQAMSVIQNYDGGAFKAKKCSQRRQPAGDEGPIDSIMDQLQGGLREIPTRSVSAPVTLLGHTSSLDGQSAAGADSLHAACMSELSTLRRGAVGWGIFRYINNAVFGGRVRYKASITRGHRRRCTQLDSSVERAAHHKRGEKGTSSTAHLHVRGGVGGGLLSHADLWAQTTITCAVAEARSDGTGQRPMMGAMESHGSEGSRFHGVVRGQLGAPSRGGRTSLYATGWGRRWRQCA